MTAPRMLEQADAPARFGTPFPVAEFEALLDGVLDAAYRTAYHLTRNPADAETLVQEAALLACRARATFQRGTNFRPWFLKILTNDFYSKCPTRRAAKAPILESPLRLFGLAQRYNFAPNPDPALTFTGRLDAETISGALEDLPLEFRVVTTMSLVEDLPYRDIASVLAIPVGTVRSRLHRGRAMLKRSLWQAAVDRGLH